MSQSFEVKRARGRIVFQVLISCDTGHEAQPLENPLTTNAIKKAAKSHPLGPTGTQIGNRSQDTGEGSANACYLL